MTRAMPEKKVVGMFRIPVVAPIAFVFSLLLGLIAYCSEPELEILPVELRIKSERICEKETGYLPTKNQG